jgi:hypothetical protein
MCGLHSFIDSFFAFYSAAYIGLSGIPLLLVTQPDSQVPNVHSDQLAAAVTPAEVNVHLYFAPGDPARLTESQVPNVHSGQLAAAVTPPQVNVHLHSAPGDTARLTGTKCPL